MKRKKKELPRLTLKKETIVQLSSAHLSSIVAGEGGPGGGTRKNCGDGDELDYTRSNCLTVACE